MARDRRTVMQRAWGMAKATRDLCGAAVDSLVYVVSPQAAAERMVMRKIIAASERRSSPAQYSDNDRDGVGDKVSRLDGPQRWLGSRLSADSEQEQGLEEIQIRSMELYRTTTAGGAIDTKCDHVVGKGFTYRSKILAQAGISDEAAKGFNSQILQLHLRWSRRCDITGRKSLWELCRLQQRSFDVWGESFTVMWATARKGQPIPLVLEVVDPARISTPPERSGDPFCRMGIQYSTDGSGEITGYWLRTTHPYDTKRIEFKWNFISAERMLHVFEQWFPGQSRGYPWMRRTLSRWRDGEDLDEAGIIAAQVEACNAAFVKTRAPLKAAQANGKMQSTGVRREDMKPGKINYLDTDSEEVLFNNPTKSNIVGTLHEWNHRRIAAGMDWPYEFLMKDWRGTSFAGGRLILNGAKIKCQVDQQRIDVAWLSVISDEVVAQGVLFGALDINLSAFQQRPWVYQQHRWTPPAWSYSITPGEEINAKVTAIENNLMTRDEALADDGDQLEDVLDQRALEQKMEEDRNVVSIARLQALGQIGKSGSSDGSDAPPQKKEQSDAT